MTRCLARPGGKIQPKDIPAHTISNPKVWITPHTFRKHLIAFYFRWSEAQGRLPKPATADRVVILASQDMQSRDARIPKNAGRTNGGNDDREEAPARRD